MIRREARDDEKRSRLSKRSPQVSSSSGAEAASAKIAVADPPDGVRLVGTLRGHTGHIGQLSWSPDGRLLASPSADKTLRIWDVPSRRPAYTITELRELIGADES